MKTKKLLIVLAIFAISGCCNESEHAPVITAKSYRTYFDTKMPEGICRYWYTTGSGTSQEFEDSCSKYNIGDTIRPR